MPTNAELKALIQEEIRDKTAEGSILKANVADGIDAGYDYTDQEIDSLTALTNAPITDAFLDGGTNGSPTLLTSYINRCQEDVGLYFYLPTPSATQKQELFVIANTEGVIIKSNLAGTARLSQTNPNTNSATVTLTLNTMTKFIHIGQGYWRVVSS